VDPVSRPVIFGEVLFDRFPDGSEVLGGAPFNVAWNLRGLGLDPLLVSRVGRDALGERILSAMQGFGLDCGALQRDDERPTGTVEVSLVDGEPRFEIVDGRAWDRIEEPRQLPEASLLYHGSLALRNPGSRTAGESLIDEAAAPVFFDVNLRDPWWDREEVIRRMQSAQAVKLNHDELDLLAGPEAGIEGQARKLLDRTGVTTLFLTRGAEGADAFTSAGDHCRTRPAGTVPVVDTVGAGDAFSSVLILGILEDWPLQFMLDRAREFAEAVVGLRGATSTDPAFYSRFRTTWSPA
jgi:fructokinase